MITTEEFVKDFGNQSSNLKMQFATVDPLYQTGNPKLIFDGEPAVSQKGYPCLESATLSAGKRVVVINGVIFGAIREVL